MDYIYTNINLLIGLETEGIFRRSPSAVELKNVINSYNAGDKVSLNII